MKPKPKCAYPGCENEARSYKKNSCCSREHADNYHNDIYKAARAAARQKCAFPGCEKPARNNRPNSCCSNLHMWKHKSATDTQKRKIKSQQRQELQMKSNQLCALPGCENIARSNRKNSTCSMDHEKKYWNILYSQQKSTIEITNICALPGCENIARTNKKNSCCSEQHKTKWSNMRKKNYTNIQLCALPGCGNESRSRRHNSCCCDEHMSMLIQIDKENQINQFGKCALDGCNNNARRSSENSCCCDEHYESMMWQRKQALLPKCALPGCDNKARTTKSNSTCCIQHYDELRKILFPLAPAKVVTKTGASRKYEAGISSAFHKLADDKTIMRRVEAIIIASKQPGYNPKNFDDIHQRVEAILAENTMELIS